MMLIMLPPGPSLPMPVQTALVWTRPHRFLHECHRRYGDVFTVRAAPMGTMVYLADPALIRTVFAGDPAVYHAGEANSIMRGVLGDSSVLVVDEAEHRARRRELLPPFHRDAVRRQAELMAEIADADVARWPIGPEFAVAPRMSAITLEVILRIVIGADDPVRLAALRRSLPAVVDMNLLDVTGMMKPELLRYPPWFGVRRRRAEADRLLYAEITARRADPGLAGRTDVLSMLVREGGMTDRQLRDQLMTLLLAGHETTATGLSWALERLTRTPDVLARAVRAARDDDTEYLDALVRETLRIRPVVHEVARTLTEPVDLGPYRIPAGAMVMPTIGLVHRRPDLYPEPERFDPERMRGATPSPVEWLPFGGGGRRCLGATFAQVEMRVVLREVLRRVELAGTDAPGEQQRVKHVTLVPSDGARIRVTARRPVAAPA
jgi:cytochrome P450 family 135